MSNKNENVKLLVDYRNEKKVKEEEAIKKTKEFLLTLISELDLEKCSNVDPGDSIYLDIMSQSSREIYEINSWEIDCDSSMFFIIDEMLKTNNVKFDNKFSINLISDKNFHDWIKICTIKKVVDECNSNYHENIDRVIDLLRNYFNESSKNIIKTENNTYFIDYINDMRKCYKF